MKNNVILNINNLKYWLIKRLQFQTDVASHYMITTAKRSMSEMLSKILHVTTTSYFQANERLAFDID